MLLENVSKEIYLIIFFFSPPIPPDISKTPMFPTLFSLSFSQKGNKKQPKKQQQQSNSNRNRKINYNCWTSKQRNELNNEVSN